MSNVAYFCMFLNKQFPFDLDTARSVLCACMYGYDVMEVFFHLKTNYRRSHTCEQLLKNGRGKKKSFNVAVL